ncbi:MAG: hypothetical protein LAO30_17405 [Acidobacteriia bacterium]|nr:hypothetical protein [Terriglobia bacterium]
MPDEHARYGGGVTDSVISPVVLVALVVALILILALPKKKVLIPVLLMTFLVPLGQQLYFAGIHLFVLRIVILVGLARALATRSGTERFLAGGWNSVDTAILACTLIEATAVVSLYQESQALINQIAFVWDWLGGYVLLRALVRSEEDVYRATKWLGIIVAVLGAGMIIEQVRLVNVFGLLGGVPLVPEIRDGKIRSQAAFSHSLTAGAFSAASVPLFLLLWKNGRAKYLAAIGVIAATIMTYATQSSTSLLTYGGGLLGLFLWPMRKKMRMVRWGLLCGLVSLHLIMKAPVWFLIARIDLTGSSSGYHRAELINEFINHFSNWWLIGTRDAASWGWDMWDAQNQFVNVGESGGLVAIVFFVLIISRSFAQIGDARKRTDGRTKQWLLWFLGAALFANCVAFFGVNYFDQSRMAWFLLLAMISACTGPILRPRRAPVNAVVSAPVLTSDELPHPSVRL